ncbi:MAG: hypothetical protein AB7P76_08205 [Candidatus Melainabacteria bacterium]
MLTFGALFEKIPTEIQAFRMPGSFVVRDHNNPAIVHRGHSGDYHVINHLNIQYVMSAPILHRKYAQVGGNTYISHATVQEGRFPEPGEKTVQTAHGRMATSVNGIPSIIMSDVSGEYPVPAKDVLALYRPRDQEAEQIFSQLEELVKDNDTTPKQPTGEGPGSKPGTGKASALDITG